MLEMAYVRHLRAQVSLVVALVGDTAYGLFHFFYGLADLCPGCLSGLAAGQSPEELVDLGRRVLAQDVDGLALFLGIEEWVRASIRRALSSPEAEAAPST